MRNKTDYAEIFRLLGEMEKCVERVRDLRRGFEARLNSL